jgi:hypothetical protein
MIQGAPSRYVGPRLGSWTEPLLWGKAGLRRAPLGGIVYFLSWTQGDGVLSRKSRPNPRTERRGPSRDRGIRLRYCRGRSQMSLDGAFEDGGCYG